MRPLRILLLSLSLIGLAGPLRQFEPTPTVTPETTVPAAPPVWVSPTPDETGAITVIVQPGDSLWAIAARAGLTLAELLALNNLPESVTINPGDVILIARVTPFASPEEGTPTATPPPPTPRPTDPRPEAALCLSAFDDRDRDGVRDADEPLRAGVAFTIYTSEAVAANYITDGVSEPKCLRALPPGEYRVTRSVVAGEVLTTAGDWTVNLSAGNELHQAFGSVMSETAGSGQAVSTAVRGQPTATAGVTAPAPGPSTTAAPTASSFDWRIAGIAALFVGGLLLLGAVLILLFRVRGKTVDKQSSSVDGERRFRSMDDLE